MSLKALFNPVYGISTSGGTFVASVVMGSMNGRCLSNRSLNLMYEEISFTSWSGVCVTATATIARDSRFPVA